jgi:uncharacterized protein YprB with RNaseH-like and TPR domain
MDLRQKLALLGDRYPSAKRGLESPAPLEPSPPDNARERVLLELREKIAAVLGRTPVERPRADPSQTTLPFERFERPEGVLYRRLERLSLSHHVGRMPVDAAASANAELLALLALDPRLSGLRFERALFVDTETTGLGGGAGVLPFLIGLAWFDAERRLFIEQLFLRRPADEPALLSRLRECVEQAEVLVTYNGKSFDLPLLAGRYVMNHLPPLPARPHLDLLHVARRLHGARIKQCRLISLESAVLGFGRGPDVAGEEIAARYGHFLRSGDESALEAVVTHNAWDVLSMAALVGLYGEPLELLPSQDLVALARTLRRAGALETAAHAAEIAVERGGGAHARRARGDIAKARGDRARALAEFEALLEDVDEPALRLELAKLYEHYKKAPGLALELLERGTGEADAALSRRRSRLELKVQRAANPRARKPRPQ